MHAKVKLDWEWILLCPGKKLKKYIWKKLNIFLRRIRIIIFMNGIFIEIRQWIAKKNRKSIIVIRDLILICRISGSPFPVKPVDSRFRVVPEVFQSTGIQHQSYLILSLYHLQQMSLRKFENFWLTKKVRLNLDDKRCLQKAYNL